MRLHELLPKVDPKALPMPSKAEINRKTER